MRITVHVEGKRFDIDIEQLPFQDTIDKVVVNGRPVDIGVSPGWPRQFSKNLIIGDHSYQVEFELDHQQLPRRVSAVGQAVDVTLDFPGKGKLRRPEMTGLWGESNQVRAPLPGRIIAVRVRSGQKVMAGELVCKLEAMKMENELVSPREGTVKEVLVSEGDSVELDQVLISLE
jgi:biotin carboxyl carrier protein